MIIILLSDYFSTVSIDKEIVTIDPLSLFLRLTVIVEKKPETDIEDYFRYELTSYPMSLFKDGVMRPAQKSRLKDYLTKFTSVMSQLPLSIRVVDGGSLLWCLNWNKGEQFSEIFEKYTCFMEYLNVDEVVFDGYETSTKDTTRSKRGSYSQAVDINPGNACPSDRKGFLSNYSNKKSFIQKLGEKLRERGITVHFCHSDADTTIAKVALSLAKERSVTVFADDTDILCLLLHHCAVNNIENYIYLASLKKKNLQRECINIHDIVQNTDQSKIEKLLFAHAFTGCDTTSAIHNFGKTSIFKKLEESKDLSRIANLFYGENISPYDIGNSTVRFFEILHSPEMKLSRIRKQKYEEMVTSDRARLDPSALPPSPKAAYYHGLRVYHQVRVWRELSDRDIHPLDWGWRLKDDAYLPIPTDEKAGPEDILKVVRCGCKGACNNRCTCRKMGLKCGSSCKTCHGINCSNAEEIDDIDGIGNYDIGDQNDDGDRNFLDAFL